MPGSWAVVEMLLGCIGIAWTETEKLWTASERLSRMS